MGAPAVRAALSPAALPEGCLLGHSSSDALHHSQHTAEAGEEQLRTDLTAKSAGTAPCSLKAGWLFYT